MLVKNFSTKQETIKTSLKVVNISRGMTFFAEKKDFIEKKKQGYKQKG